MTRRNSFTTRIGDMPPGWLVAAMDDGRIKPVKDGGPNNWARDGLIIVATGQVIPLGGTITKEMVR